MEAARVHLAGLGLSVDLRCADAVELPFDHSSFDHVWMMSFLEHVADPVAVLREARRVLSPGGELTASEVDYNTVWATPTTDAFEALFAAVTAAGFASVDPGELRLNYSGAALGRQVPYVADVVESTLPALAEVATASVSQLEAGLADLRALPSIHDAAMGWDVHKAKAVC